MTTKPSQTNPKAILSTIPSLSTARLQLRRFAMEDLDDVYGYIGDPEVTRYLIVETQTRAQTRAWLEQRLAEYQKSSTMTWWPWAIVLRSENKVIGGCALRNLDTAAGRIEIAYALAQRCWRRGLMSEALSALVEFCFARLHLYRVEAIVMPENVASCRMLEKLGFQREGVLRHRDYLKGAHHDMAMYALLREEWRAPQPRSS